MRQARWFSLCGLVLAGCVSVDSNSSDADLPPIPLPKEGPPPFSTATADMTTMIDSPAPATAAAPPKTPEQNALARCLPGGLNLAMTIYPPDGPPFALEKRLAEIGAHCRADGVLVDGKGNVLSTCNAHEVIERPVVKGPIRMSNSEEESRKFLEPLLTPDQLARWKANGREFRLMWSFEKDAYDRVMLFPENFGALPTASSTPPAPANLQRP